MKCMFFEMKEYDTPEAYKRADEMQALYSRTVMIESSDDLSELLSVGELYREAKMSEIRKGLESLREREERK